MSRPEFDSRKLEKMTVEIMSGSKRSFTGPGDAELYKELEASIAAQLKYDIPPGFAVETPDVGGDD